MSRDLPIFRNLFVVHTFGRLRVVYRFYLRSPISYAHIASRIICAMPNPVRNLPCARRGPEPGQSRRLTHWLCVVLNSPPRGGHPDGGALSRSLGGDGVDVGEVDEVVEDEGGRDSG